MIKLRKHKVTFESQHLRTFLLSCLYDRILKKIPFIRILSFTKIKDAASLVSLKKTTKAKSGFMILY